MKNPLPPKSRYAGVEVLQLARPGEKPIPYLARRFIPPPAHFATLHRHQVTQGERLDRLAAQYLGDPEMFWLIADANLATDPADLTATPGRALRITLPAGLPGPPED